MRFRYFAAAVLAAGTLVAVAATPASATVVPPPQPVGVQAGADVHVGGSPLCRTAVTHLVDRPDSGGHGTWALDTIVRTTTICETALIKADVAVKAPVVADVKPVVLARYHATVTDVGTFVTVDGHSPNRGLPLCRGCRGHLAGGFTADFTAVASFKGYAAVYAGHTYSGAAPTSTGNWLVGLWGGADIHLAAADNLVGWSWTYWTCGDLPRAGTRGYLAALHAGLLWVDAYNNGDGTGVLAGDITNCRCVEHSPSPKPSVSVSPSPSPSVSVSPSVSQSTGTGGSNGGSGGTGGGVVVQPPTGNGGGVVAVQPAANQSSSLPVTGAPVAYLAGGAAVLLGLGLGLTVLARRRRFTA